VVDRKLKGLIVKIENINTYVPTAVEGAQGLPDGQRSRWEDRKALPVTGAVTDYVSDARMTA
jgi:hypothetical protein